MKETNKEGRKNKTNREGNREEGRRSKGKREMEKMRKIKKGEGESGRFKNVYTKI